MNLDLIGVPFDSYGRDGAVALAAGALRNAGLVELLDAAHRLRDRGDLPLPTPSAERASGSGLLNQDALLALTGAAREAVRDSCRRGNFPLLVGGDCAVLLGALAAVVDQHRTAGMLFVDGHEDAFPLERSPDGQAADSEVALALGMTGESAPAELRAILPLLAPERLAMLGIRNSAELEEEGFESLRGRVLLRSDRDVLDGDAATLAAEALAAIAPRAEPWWLHTDLDVLSVDAFDAQDFPEPGGIGWDELRALTSTALSTPGCAGWSVVIYNPERDPDGSSADRIVRFIVDIAGSIGTELKTASKQP